MTRRLLIASSRGRRLRLVPLAQEAPRAVTAPPGRSSSSRTRTSPSSSRAGPSRSRPARRPSSGTAPRRRRARKPERRERSGGRVRFLARVPLSRTGGRRGRVARRPRRQARARPARERRDGGSRGRGRLRTESGPGALPRGRRARLRRAGRADLDRERPRRAGARDRRRPEARQRTRGEPDAHAVPKPRQRLRGNGLRAFARARRRATARMLVLVDNRSGAEFVPTPRFVLLADHSSGFSSLRARNMVGRMEAQASMDRSAVSAELSEFENLRGGLSTPLPEGAPLPCIGGADVAVGNDRRPNAVLDGQIGSRSGSRSRSVPVRRRRSSGALPAGVVRVYAKRQRLHR